MTDEDAIAAARQTHLQNMFVVLVRGLEAGDKNAAGNFDRGLTTLANAERIAIKALTDARQDAPAKP